MKIRYHSIITPQRLPVACRMALPCYLTFSYLNFSYLTSSYLFPMILPLPMFPLASTGAATQKDARIGGEQTCRPFKFLLFIRVSSCTAAVVFLLIVSHSRPLCPRLSFPPETWMKKLRNCQFFNFHCFRLVSCGT